MRAKTTRILRGFKGCWYISKLSPVPRAPRKRKQHRARERKLPSTRVPRRGSFVIYAKGGDPEKALSDANRFVSHRCTRSALKPLLANDILRQDTEKGEEKL